MDKQLDDLIIQLKFIGKTPPEHKVDLKVRSFSKNTWGGAIIRLFYGESSNDLTEKLPAYVEQSRLMFIKYQEDADAKEKLSDALREMISGLSNLLKSYEGKPAISASIEVCMRNINNLLKNNTPVVKIVKEKNNGK